MNTDDKHPNPADVLEADLLGEIASAVKPQPLGAGRKRALRDRILSRIDPSAPAASHTIRADEMRWTAFNPLVDVKILYRSSEQNTQTALWRLRPGAVVPGHAHSQEEECWVVEGEVDLDDHRLRQGDMHIAQPGCQHPAFFSRNGALLLVRSELRT